MTYKRHRQHWNNCDACDLVHCRSKVVLARGKIPCDLLFIGEAPGLSEDTLGYPFAGPAGRLLDDQISTALGVDSWDTVAHPRICLTNLIACIPKELTWSSWCPSCGKEIEDEDYTRCQTCKSQLDSYVEIGSKAGEPPKQSIAACGERLREFYDLVKPRKVVLVGKLSERHAPKLLDLVVEGTIAITHPAAILRAGVAQQGLLYQRVCVQLEDLFEELEDASP